MSKDKSDKPDKITDRIKEKETFLEALTSYYKLKEEYENKYTKKKNRILHNPALSRKDKVRQYQQIKRTCLNCGKDGGIVFSDKSNILSAICGHDSNPCELNIQIQREPVVSLETLTLTTKRELEETQRDIILTKLDLLFNYSSESETVGNFETLKDELDKYFDFYQKVNTKYLDVVLNKNKKDRLTEENINLYISIQKLKKYMLDYEKTNDIGFIKDSLDLYLSDIEPISKKIRELKYDQSTIEKVDDVYHLIQEPYTISSLEYGSLGNVISNIK